MTRPTITLDTLFYSDRIQYQSQVGDEHIYTTLTVAEVKELIIAINVSNERILSLSRELEQAEGTIEDLKQRLDAVERAQE